MPGWLIPRQFVCVDCGVTYLRVTPRSTRCKECQYKFVLLKNMHKRHKGPFVFDCADCGVKTVSPHPLQKYCRDCMRPHALWFERLNNAKWAPYRHKLLIHQCTDCGCMIDNAMPAQKRCPGCQILRGVTTEFWRPLRRTGKPIECQQCGAPVIKFNFRRRFCNECTRKIRYQRVEAHRQEIMRDPLLFGQYKAKRERYRRQYRSVVRDLMRDPQQIEQAVWNKVQRFIGETK